MPHTEPDVGGQIGCRVEDFVHVHAGGGRAYHVADGIAAGLAAGQTHGAQQPQHVGALGQGDVMKLDVLPGGDVTPFQGSVTLGHRAQGIQSVGGEDTAGDFHPDHLYVGLPLTIDALFQTEGSKLGVFLFTGLKEGRFRLKSLHLVLHKGDDSRSGRGQFHTLVVDFLRGWRLGNVGFTGQLGLLEILGGFVFFDWFVPELDLRPGKIKPTKRQKLGGCRRVYLDANTTRPLCGRTGTEATVQVSY